LPPSPLPSASAPRRRNLFIIAGLALAALALATWIWSDESRALAQHAMTLGRWPAFIALLILPLIGFPLSVLALAAGLRFGLVPALLLMAPALAFHLVFSFFVARHWLKRPLLRWLSHYDFTLPRAPDGESFSVALLINFIPGPPYFAKNYLLAVAELPFRAYFFAGLIANLLNTSMGILAGDFFRHMNLQGGAILTAYVLIISFFCHRLVRQLRRRAAPPASAARD
jgi:uncharacterized membrane protein YdjX (TVP38/TMEM64 family)